MKLFADVCARSTGDEYEYWHALQMPWAAILTTTFQDCSTHLPIFLEVDLFLAGAPPSPSYYSGGRLFIDRNPGIRFAQLVLVSLEVLDFAFMFFGGRSSGKRAEVASLPGLLVDLA